MPLQSGLFSVDKLAAKRPRAEASPPHLQTQNPKARPADADRLHSGPISSLATRGPQGDSEETAMRADKRSAPRWRGLSAFFAAVMCLLGVGAATPVHAGPMAEPPPNEPIAIVKLPFAGIANEVETSLHDLLRSTLNRVGFSVLPAQVVQNRLSGEQRLFGCTTASCYGRIAQILGVGRIIEGEVQKLGLEFSLQLWLRDLYTGKLVAPPAKEVCPVCSSEEMRQTVIRAAELLAQLAPPKGPQEQKRPAESGMLSVETDPPGAHILIDRVERSERTPATLLLGPGIHDLQLDGAGYEVLHHKVEVSSGKQVSLSYVLTPKQQRKSWLRPLAWTGTLLTVGLAVGAGVLLYYNGRPVTSMDCPDQPGLAFHCPQKYDNLAVGVAAAVGAGVLAIGSGLAFYFDASAPRRRPIAEIENDSAPATVVEAPNTATVPGVSPPPAATTMPPLPTSGPATPSPTTPPAKAGPGSPLGHAPSVPAPSVSVPSRPGSQSAPPSVRPLSP